MGDEKGETALDKSEAPVQDAGEQGEEALGRDVNELLALGEAADASEDSEEQAGPEEPEDEQAEEAEVESGDEAGGLTDEGSEGTSDAGAERSPEQNRVEALEAQIRQMQPLVELALANLRKGDQAPEKPAAPAWDPPHADDPGAVSALRLIGTEAFGKLDQETQQRAMRLGNYVDQRWGRYQLHPEKFVEEHVLPVLEGAPIVKRVLAMEKQLARMADQELVRRHAAVLRDPRDVEEFGKLLAEMPEARAAEFLAMKRQLGKLSAGASKVDEDRRRIEAQRSAERGTQHRKARGRGNGKPSLPSDEELRKMGVGEIAGRVKRFYADQKHR